MIVSNPVGGLQIRFHQIQRVLERITSGELIIWDIGDQKPIDLSSPTLLDRGHTEPQAFPPSNGVIGILHDIATLVLHTWPFFVAQSLIGQRDRILAWINEEQPTHVVVVHPYATELVPDLRRRNIRVFVDCHNVESDLARQLTSLIPLGPEKLHALVLRRVFEQREKRYLPIANEVWVPSEINAQRLRKICHGNVLARCVSNAVDITQYHAYRNDITHDIVFPAEFGYRPNALGAEILCQRVLPIVREAIPDSRLVLVGRDQKGWAKALQHEPDVHVTGEVPDTRSYLYQAGVIPVPILQGSGTRFKILEALALELPVVTTPLGCEGLDVQDGEHLLIREIDEFASAIISILLNPSSGRILGHNGRNLIESRYSLEIIEDVVREALI